MKKLNHFSNQILVAAGVFVWRAARVAANVSPLGSFGFFGRAPVAYFATIIAFDWLVGGFYSGFLWTYIAFAAYPMFGYFARGNWRRQAVLLPLASFAFFAISNAGVWWHWYPHTWSGLLTCYTLALPFYVRTLLGDVTFGYGYLFCRWLVRQKNWQSLHQSVPLFRQA
ncbi:hypothetical protein LRY65_04335 [Candidatus Woesebacteria bacterium]|nr:hypothetical protein [Candidatus Woesebacteria bacterium]MCD8527407.1 hypothetical protein [Candidatus Woesebacteria bacterium]MCD8546153.1 hypothetical protein [Candidatus Woesebacteria bacterium]